MEIFQIEFLSAPMGPHISFFFLLTDCVLVKKLPFGKQNFLPKLTAGP